MTEELFAEVAAERSAIHQFEGGLTREEADKLAATSTELFRHQCEIRDVVARYKKAVATYGEKKAKIAIDKFYEQVAGHRGQPAADRLRVDALKQLNGEK